MALLKNLLKPARDFVRNVRNLKKLFKPREVEFAWVINAEKANVTFSYLRGQGKIQAHVYHPEKGRPPVYLTPAEFFRLADQVYDMARLIKWAEAQKKFSGEVKP